MCELTQPKIAFVIRGVGAGEVYASSSVSDACSWAGGGGSWVLGVSWNDTGGKIVEIHLSHVVSVPAFVCLRPRGCMLKVVGAIVLMRGDDFFCAESVCCRRDGRSQLGDLGPCSPCTWLF